MRFRPWRPGKREMVFFGVWCAAAALFVMKNAVGRMASENRDLDSRIGASEAKLLKLNRLYAHAGQVNAEYEHRIIRNESLGNGSSLIRGIENLARKAGVTLLSLKPAQSREDGQRPCLRVEIQDDLAGIARFFGLVNAELRGTGVERVQIFTQNADEPPHAAFVITLAGV